MATMEASPVLQPKRIIIRRLGSQMMDWLSSSNQIWMLELACLLALAAVAIFTTITLIGQPPQSDPLSPTAAAALLVANLVPMTTFVMLLGRRLALKRAPEGGGLLHIRMVVIFSLLAAVPALLLAIFASLLFQSGVQFWSSASARNMLENSGALAKGYYEEKLRDVGDKTTAMAADISFALNRTTPQDPRFVQAYFNQVLNRELSESAIVVIDKAGIQQTTAVISPDDNRKANWISEKALRRIASGEKIVVSIGANRIEAVTRLSDAKNSYLYASRAFTVPSFMLGEKAQGVLDDYRSMISRSRNLQFQFNAMLYFVSLIIISLAVWIALIVADRLVRPVNSLVLTAQRISEGDLTARVADDYIQNDEVGFLARSFNKMTERLESQTGNMIRANEQLDNRRAFIETILESVSAAVLSTEGDGRIRLANGIAEKLLGASEGSLSGRMLKDAAPFLTELIEQGRNQAIVQIGDGAEPQTLAVKITPLDVGHVVTFEDITQQLTDQRQAAWADVARRIAHEIKNPLTPIQLAAERLQRRFGKEIDLENAGIFNQLTGTIIRQVGDLRNIVDEFSSFARMPKPIFRDESLSDIVGHSVFLFEVAHNDIRFEFDAPADGPALLCDRRQIGQAVTNILKNAAEAIEGKRQAEPKMQGLIDISIASSTQSLDVIVRDNGIGLPEGKERLVEPYVTTRATGSGLGLAIVKKIMEEHQGEVLFQDADDGGAQVTLRFFPDRLIMASSGVASAPQKSRKRK
jgi:two-component system, NtrC family, nitrogen regulation sensor histidine kinase NtrY